MPVVLVAEHSGMVILHDREAVEESARIADGAAEQLWKLVRVFDGSVSAHGHPLDDPAAARRYRTVVRVNVGDDLADDLGFASPSAVEAVRPGGVAGGKVVVWEDDDHRGKHGCGGAARDGVYHEVVVGDVGVL